MFFKYFSQVHFEAYNRRYGDDGIHESLEWDENEVAFATSNFCDILSGNLRFKFASNVCYRILIAVLPVHVKFLA